MNELSQNQPERFVSLLTRNTLALVLCGGRGSRLKNLTEWRAKPAVPFGGKFRIIDFALSNCLNSGIRKIGVLTQYKSDSLIRHVQNGWGFMRSEIGEFVHIMPAQQRMEELWYQGTADAIYQNLDILRGHDPEFVLVLAGDHIYKMEYGPMLADHVANDADLTIGCIEVPREDARAFGVMKVANDRRVCDFLEKPDEPPMIPGNNDSSLVSMGIYIFNTSFLYEQLIKDADTRNSTRDFGKDIIPNVIQNYRVYAYPFLDLQSGQQAYWRDVGTVDAYWSANIELASVDPELNLYDREWPIWTYQEQVPPAKFVFDDDDRRGQALDSLVSGGCVVSGGQIKRSVLFTNARVNCHAVITDSVLLPDVSIGRRARIHKAIIDKGCIIPDDTVIGEDLDADRKKFYVSPEGVVLVTPDSMGQNIHFNR